MFYKLIMEGGHMGAGKSYEMVRYFQGGDIFSVLSNARRMPRLKKKDTSVGIKLIAEISRHEYLDGKKQERSDPYLNHHCFA